MTSVNEGQEHISDNHPRFMVKTSATTWTSNDGKVRLVNTCGLFDGYWLREGEWVYPGWSSASPGQARRVAEAWALTGKPISQT